MCHFRLISHLDPDHRRSIEDKNKSNKNTKKFCFSFETVFCSAFILKASGFYRVLKKKTFACYLNMNFYEVGSKKNIYFEEKALRNKNSLATYS